MSADPTRDVPLRTRRFAALKHRFLRRAYRDVRQYVRDEVHCQFENVDVLAVDWAGKEAQQLIEGVYQAAYASLG